MRVLSVIVCVAVLVMCSSKFVSIDNIQDLLIKYGRKNLTSTEHDTLHDFFGVVHTPVTRTTFADSKAKTTAQCLVCNLVISAIIVLVNTGSTDDSLIEVGTNFCVDFGLFSHDVCQGAITLNFPIMSYVIRNSPEVKSDMFCSLLIQSNEDPEGCPHVYPQVDWTVLLPEPPLQMPIIKKRKRTEPYTFAIVTDPHLDPFYEPYSDTNCEDPICCHATYKSSSRQGRTVLDLATITSSITTINGKTGVDVDKATKNHQTQMKNQTKQKNEGPAGYWGSYKKCDSPIWAFDDVIDRISETHKNIDAVYFIGDSVNHVIWNTSYDSNQRLNKYVAEKLRSGFGDDVLVVPAIGNHEAHPVNQFAPPSIIHAQFNTTWLYKNLADLYSYYLTEEAKYSLAQHGSFSVLFKKRLRIISINNNIAQRYNWWLVFDPLQPKKLLEWLVYELYKAERAGEKVHILAHVPPGYTDLTYIWTREYNKVINRFSSIIMAEFNGHTHTDEFRIFYNLSDSSQPIAVAWGAGGATTYSNYNLNYKVITVDPNTYELNSMKTYIYNLAEANLSPEKRPRWFQLYDLHNSYRLKNITPTSMNELVLRMATGEKQLLDLYSAYFTKLSSLDYCDTNCKADRLCQIVVTVLWDRTKCEELKKLYLSNAT